MESEPSINFEHTATVDELISFLRSTFLSADFQNVTKTLTLREQGMKQSLDKALTEAEKWKNDYLSAEKMLLKHLTLEEECEAMKEKIIALTEQNKDLCSSKSRAQADAEKWERMYKEVDARVSRLEDELRKNPVIKKELVSDGICTGVQKGGTDPYSINVACVNGGTTIMEFAGGAENFCKFKDSSLAGDNQAQSREVINIDSDDEEPARDISTSCKNVRPSDEEKMFLKIEGSDQIGMVNAADCLLASNKRKRADIITCKQESSDDYNAPRAISHHGYLLGEKRKQKLDNLPQTSPVESRLGTSSVGGNNMPDVSPTSKPPGFVRLCTVKSEAKLSSSLHLSNSSDSSDSDDGNDGDDYINRVFAIFKRRREALNRPPSAVKDSKPQM